MKKVIGLIIGLVPISAYAQCIPPPDCASIGYIETSCDGDSLKCPFDTTKLYCPPCDSSFKYSCTGDNIKNPVGNACNNKYAHCECIAGATFTNGECVCTTECVVGAIYYSDNTCNTCLDNTKTPIGVVVKNNELIMTTNYISTTWGKYGRESPLINIKEDILAQKDFSGKENTITLVEYFADNTDDTVIASTYCYNYAPTEREDTKNQWYLPAAGELYHYVYKNYSQLSATYIKNLNWEKFNYDFWSSSEQSQYYAWNVNSYDGSTRYYYYHKSKSFATTCFLAIN